MCMGFVCCIFIIFVINCLSHFSAEPWFIICSACLFLGAFKIGAFLSERMNDIFQADEIDEWMNGL